MTPLCRLAEKFGTDKYSKHGYTKVYYEMFYNRIESTKRILEVGIKRGASLRMWEEFFPASQVFGIDIKTRNLINEGRITSFFGDQGKPETLTQAANEATADGLLDIVIDDGKHKAVYQAMTAVALLPFLASDGVYVIEDVKHGENDNPQEIVQKISKDFHCEMVFTNDMWDSGLMVITRC